MITIDAVQSDLLFAKINTISTDGGATATKAKMMEQATPGSIVSAD